MPRARPPQPAYLAHVVPGLESVAAYELGERVPRAGAVRALTGFDERTSLVSFSYAGAAADLLTLRTLEDVFILGAEAESVPGGWSGLRVVQAAVAESPLLEMAAALGLERRGHVPRKPTFRVVTRKAGEHAFRRVDLQQAVERAVRERFPAWRLVEEGAHLELWVQLVGGVFVAGFRLSTGELRRRTYKSASLPASLKPTIAAAMALLSRPRPDDVVLDPMCGAGTILIERAETARYAKLLGGDQDSAAVRAARQNVGPRYQPIELREWDARALPLAEGSVSAVICNLPFGKQIGSPAQVRQLYPALLKEWSRVLAPEGRMVLLTSEHALLTHAVAGAQGLRVRERIPLLVRGLPAAVYLISSRRGAAGS